MNKGKFRSLQGKLSKILRLKWENYLASGGKEVLIESVVQAIPIYIMGVFKLSCGLCEYLTCLIRNFQWGSGKGKRKTHWL